jgi:hypothetical protein
MIERRVTAAAGGTARLSWDRRGTIMRKPTLSTSGSTPEHASVASAGWLLASLPPCGVADGVANLGDQLGQWAGQVGGRCGQRGHGVARRSGGKAAEIAAQRLQRIGSLWFELRHSGLGLGCQAGAAQTGLYVGHGRLSDGLDHLLGQATVGRITASGTAGQFRLHLVSFGFPLACICLVASRMGDLCKTVVVAR